MAWSGLSRHLVHNRGAEDRCELDDGNLQRGPLPVMQQPFADAFDGYGNVRSRRRSRSGVLPGQQHQNGERRACP